MEGIVPMSLSLGIPRVAWLYCCFDFVVRTLQHFEQFTKFIVQQQTALVLSRRLRVFTRSGVRFISGHVVQFVYERFYAYAFGDQMSQAVLHKRNVNNVEQILRVNTKTIIEFTFLKFSTVSGLNARHMPITNVLRPLTTSSISSFSRRFAYGKQEVYVLYSTR